jgi:hypothetical protein
VERYEVELVYNLRGDAAPGLTGIGDAASRAEKSTGSLKGALLGLGAAIGTSALFSKGRDAFVAFNSEIEQSQLAVAAVSRMFTPGQTFDQAMAGATATFGRYQEAAKASTATTKDFISMHQALVPSFAAAGIAGQRLEQVVQDATVAAPLLLPGMGDAAGYFARDLQSMLKGQVQQKDQAAMMLVKAVGLDKETFNKKAGESAEFAVTTIQQAMTKLTGGGVKQGLEQSFAGVTSTLEDTFQILAGEAGQPLFKAITEEVKSWNKWLGENRLEVERMKNTVSGGLLTGFHALKDFTGYMVEHKDALLAVGTVWAGLKGIQIAGGAVGGLSETVAGLSSLGKEANNGASGLARIAGQAGGVVGALFALYQAAKLGASLLDAHHKKSVLGDASIGALSSQIGIALGSRPGDKQLAAGAVASQLREAGALTAAGTVDRDKFRAWAESQGEGPAAAIMLAVQAEKAMAKGNQAHIDRIAVQFSRETVSKAKQKKDPSVNVNISRIEVASDDPDRFVMGLVRFGHRVASRAVQSKYAIPMYPTGR